MSFTDKVLSPIREQMEDLSVDVRLVTQQIGNLAAVGMIAFALISIVAVTALVKASIK
jgi:hypothetical protein